ASIVGNLLAPARQCRSVAPAPADGSVRQRLDFFTVRRFDSDEAVVQVLDFAWNSARCAARWHATIRASADALLSSAEHICIRRRAVAFRKAPAMASLAVHVPPPGFAYVSPASSRR
ncbi:hypothetical protein MTO96_037024, partial [Rhipicephalus appendiculatus]